MNATPSRAIPDHLTVVLTLSHVLDRLESSATAVAAEQYRSVVARLSDELARVEPSPALQAILDSHRPAAELYENLHYRHAGLCRSPLELSLNAELRAKEVIARAKRTASAA